MRLGLRREKQKKNDPAQPIYESATNLLTSLKQKMETESEKPDHFAAFISQEMKNPDYLMQCKHEVVNSVMKYQRLSKDAFD